MRVLWLSHVVPFPPKAGVLLRAYHLLGGVAERHDVDLVAFVQRPMLATFYQNLDAGLEECRVELASFCRSVTFLPIEKAVRPYGRARTALESLFSGRGYMASWLDGPNARRDISRIRESGRYDVAHFDSLSLACFRPLLPDPPATLGHHNAESHMMVRRSERERSWVKRMYFRLEGARLRRYERTIAPDFDIHITCSELDSERLRETMPTSRFVAIPNGVDTTFFALEGHAETPNSLIFVGTMNWYPNVDAVMFLLRDVWPMLRAHVPGVTFDIVGAGAPRRLTDLAARSPGVTLHGFVPEIRPLIERAALYVCPIRDGGGTKLKILDALAMQKCIVAHPVACEGIAVTPGTDIVFATGAADFAKTVEQLLADPVKRASIGRAARILAHTRYSFPSIAASFCAALESVAAIRIRNRHS